ncbi:MAG TPA: NAD(P)/FAD-dependent oxidoreductase [Polyangia bacterium]
MRRDVVVIGSGIGGSAAAALLAKAGLRTLLVEKNPRIGGSCGWYDKRGFRVDYGTHLFTRGERGPLGVALRRLGARAEFLRVDDLAEVRGPGLKLIVPAQAWRMPQFCVEAVRQLRIPARELPKIIRLFYDILSMPRHEAEEWDGRTVEEFIFRYTEHPRLFGLFGFLLGLYFILPPWEVSAGESILAFQGMVRDNRLSYVRGGSGAIPRAFVGALERYGGEVRVRAGARAIEPLSSGGFRVELKDGSEVRARAVVSTSSLADLLSLTGAARFPVEYAARARAIRKSYVAVQAKVGLRKKRERSGCIVGGWSRDPAFDPMNVTREDYRAQFASLDRGEVPQVVPLYCPIPSNFDPALAPPGGQLLTACAVAPCTDVRRPEDTRAHARNDRAYIDALLAAMQALMPGCLDDAEFVDTMGTEALAAWIGKAGGPAVSTGQTPDQVGARRPSVRTPLSGLYVCGDSAGGRGIGTELAAASAMECVSAVCADLSRLAV